MKQPFKLVFVQLEPSAHSVRISATGTVLNDNHLTFLKVFHMLLSKKIFINLKTTHTSTCFIITNPDRWDLINKININMQLCNFLHDS